MNAASGTGYRIAEHARLDARNTFGVRASAPMLVEATEAAALTELFGYAMLRAPSTLVLGGGSNLLFAGDAPGAVLALDTRRIDLVEDHGTHAVVRADARIRHVDEIGRTTIGRRNRVPVTVGDVATVRVGGELRTGAASTNGLEVVIGTALVISLPQGQALLTTNTGTHGFSEVLYNLSSASNNNGSAFGGMNPNTPFINTVLGICMFFARFPLAVGMLAIAGSLAAKKHVPPSAGTLPTHTPLFVVLLAITVVIVGALTFLPALALGPIAEQLMSATP